VASLWDRGQQKDKKRPKSANFLLTRDGHQIGDEALNHIRVAAYTWKRRPAPLNRWVPLGGAVALLAFLGTQGERTDILAHVAGLGVGGLFGWVFGTLDARRLVASWHKHALGLGATLLIVLAWSLAF
jgi:drug/metabolite transporter (DMT)-like permease